MLYFMQSKLRVSFDIDAFWWWWYNLIMWWHDRLQAGIVEACQFYINCLTPVLTWIKSCSCSSSSMLPHVFCKEYGLVSCKPLSLYTPNRGAVMRVLWPWIKARHPVRGHGCFRLGPRGGHPLERAYINLIPCYSRLWSPHLKSFSWTMSRVIPSIEM